MQQHHRHFLPPTKAGTVAAVLGHHQGERFQGNLTGRRLDAGDRRGELRGAVAPLWADGDSIPRLRDARAAGVSIGPHDSEEPIMQAIITIGLDIAKTVFQVHGWSINRYRLIEVTI